jgi:hypothetical protein
LIGFEAKGPGRIDANDLYDLQHFVDAVYADVLVTDDKNFHRIAAETGESGVTLQCSRDWARAFVAGS